MADLEDRYQRMQLQRTHDKPDMGLYETIWTTPEAHFLLDRQDYRVAIGWELRQASGDYRWYERALTRQSLHGVIAERLCAMKSHCQSP